MIELILTLKDLILNIITLGAWGRSQGDMNSGAWYVEDDDR